MNGRHPATHRLPLRDSSALTAAVPERGVVLAVTYVVVTFSIPVQGLTVGPLVRCLTARTGQTRPPPVAWG